MGGLSGREEVLGGSKGWGACKRGAWHLICWQDIFFVRAAADLPGALAIGGWRVGRGWRNKTGERYGGGRGRQRQRQRQRTKRNEPFGKAGILAFLVSEGQPQKVAGPEPLCQCPTHTGPARGWPEHAGISGASRSLEGRWKSQAGALFPVEGNCAVACSPGLLEEATQVPQHWAASHREDREGHSALTREAQQQTQRETPPHSVRRKHIYLPRPPPLQASSLPSAWGSGRC